MLSRDKWDSFLELENRNNGCSQRTVNHQAIRGYYRRLDHPQRKTSERFFYFSIEIVARPVQI